jgi:hypothetical protein
MRTEWARRWSDLVRILTNHVGGPDIASEPERALARRAATLIVRLEQMEASFTEAETGGTDAQFDVYAKLTNTLRRVLHSLGLKRPVKDVTPDLHSYVRNRTDRRRLTLEHEDA